MKQLHTTQLEILKKLAFTPHARFTDLKPDSKMENSKFNFHLDKLLGLGYVSKGEDEKYSLTSTGKEYSGRIDTEGSVKVVRQAKIGAFVCPIRKTPEGNELLVYTRHKHPFYGCQGFMSGKIEYGEGITQSASRELEEETGLSGKTEIVAIRHYLVTEEGGRVVEDKLIFWCRSINPVGEIRPTDEGVFEWVRQEDIDNYVTKPFETMEVLHEQIDTYVNFDGVIDFQEIVVGAEKF